MKWNFNFPFYSMKSIFLNLIQYFHLPAESGVVRFSFHWNWNLKFDGIALVHFLHVDGITYYEQT